MRGIAVSFTEISVKEDRRRGHNFPTQQETNTSIGIAITIQFFSIFTFIICLHRLATKYYDFFSRPGTQVSNVKVSLA